jgi:hypothetical protein
MEVLRQKAENSDSKAMGSSTTLLGSSARAHSMPSARNDALQKSLSATWAQAQPCWAQVHLPFNSHQSTRMRTRKSFKPEWARAHACCARAHPAELAKMQTCTRTPIRPFLFTKALIPLIFALERTSFVFLVVSCKKGTLKGGKGVFLHGLQTLELLYKAIAIPSLKTNELGSRFRPFSLL